MATTNDAHLMLASIPATQQQTTNIQAHHIHSLHHSQQPHINHQQPEQQRHHHNHQHHQQQPRTTLQQLHQILSSNQYHQLVGNVSTISSDDLFGRGSGSQQQKHNHDQHHMDPSAMQQVASQLQKNLSIYLTPATSEQDPISDKTEGDDLSALLKGNGLLPNNLLYNPQTDIGSVTPYKSQQQQQTPSYYSSVCESLTTPKAEGQKHQKPVRASNTKPKRVRTIFTPEQLKRLEFEFNNQMYLVGHDRCCLADSLNLSEAQVKVWFQNRRIKHRKLNPFV